MTDFGAGRTHRVSLWAWPVIALRLAALLCALVVAVLFYYIAAALPGRNPVPRWFLRSVTAIAGVRLKIAGRREHGRCFLLANHVSWIDVPALASITGTAFVAHDGLSRIGPLRWLCEMNDTVFVARHQRTDVTEQIARIRNALAQTGALTIFPEGTTEGRGTLPFKSSLLSVVEGYSQDYAVQPVWLDYGAHAETAAWVGDDPGIDNALRILGRVRPLRLTVHFLAPLTAEQCADRKQIAKSARTAINAAGAQVSRP